MEWVVVRREFGLNALNQVVISFFIFSQLPTLYESSKWDLAFVEGLSLGILLWYFKQCSASFFLAGAIGLWLVGCCFFYFNSFIEM